MFSLVRRPRWLGLLALALVLCVTFWWLGLWQWHRHFTRADLNAAVDTAQALPVTPLVEVMPDPEVLPPDAEYRTVSASGHYVAAEQRLLRNANGRAGFGVITPLRLDTGGTLLVNRGFVPYSLASPNTPADDVTPPTGPVTIETRLRAPQGAPDQPPPGGQLYAIDPTSYPEALEQPVYAAFGDLAMQTPTPDPDVELPPAASIGMGPHLFYAIQWWSFIAIALIGYLVLLRREARETDRSAPITDAAAGAAH